METYKRILTAVILIPIFVLCILYLSPFWFALLTIAFVILAAWEWSSFMGIKLPLLRLCYPVFIFPFFSISLAIPIFFVLIATLIFWLIAFTLVVAYPKFTRFWSKNILVLALMGIFVLIPAWRALNFLRGNYSPYILLFVFVLIWIADSGAYFAGRLFGKHKLAPSVSPGKTWEGFAGALIFSSVFSLSLIWLIPEPIAYWKILLLGITTVIFSVLGDLFESMLKRNVQLKDSGQLFPGHGGLLDRIDSLTAAVPTFAFLELVLKILH